MDDPAVSLQTYIDAQLHELRRAADLAATVPTEQVPLRDHLEQVIEDLKAYFTAILEEQRRSVVVAEQEREKAAKALRSELERSIKEGYTNLREHIAAQVGQIREALFSQEKLDVQRHATNDQRVLAVQREIAISFEASEKAISKAEAANERRFESVNEFRQSLSDQTSEFIRREVFDAKFSELSRAISDLADKINKIV